jgi:hypothetical protein
MASYVKHNRLFAYFFFCVNRENGSISVDPFTLALFPYKTFMGLRLLQDLFVVNISEKNEAAAAKAKQRPTRARR